MIRPPSHASGVQKLHAAGVPRLQLLLVVPHPDDETFGSGGTLLDFLSQGEPVGLITLTRGEGGKTLGLCDTREELAALRTAELRACLDILGLTAETGSVHEQHAFPDGGVAAHLTEVTRLTGEALLRYRPEIVLTFPPDGLNGHADHVATHQAVKAAWESLPPQLRPQLWYYALDPTWLTARSEAYLPPNLVRDVSAFVTARLRAMGCHRSQGLTLANSLRRFPERVTHETFHVVKTGG